MLGLTKLEGNQGCTGKTRENEEGRPHNVVHIRSLQASREIFSQNGRESNIFLLQSEEKKKEHKGMVEKLLVHVP